MNIEQIKKLAELARLDVPEAALATISHDMGSIVAFVDEIQNVQIEHVSAQHRAVNVFREDSAMPLVPAHDLVEVAPVHRDNFVQVPKVIGE